MFPFLCFLPSPTPQYSNFDHESFSDIQTLKQKMLKEQKQSFILKITSGLHPQI